MMFIRRKRKATQGQYATRADFCRILENEMTRLYLLAFLLTANHADAERCFVAAVDDARKGNAVFKEWSRSWVRRAIIKNAIRIVSPTSNLASGKIESWPESPLRAIIDTLVKLAPLERFVFVMSVLERYAIRECALLLECPRKR
jgi:DNA-directed RNA polymerase specialized sigma24 family protein